MILRDQDRRLLARWAAACAARTLRLFEAAAPADSRPRDALAALRAYARGGRRNSALRSHVWAALAAAREVDDPAGTAAGRAAAVAAGIAYTHTNVTAPQTKHVFAPAAYAARARELAADDRSAADREIRWAIEHASPAIRALVRRMPVRKASRGRLDALMHQLDAGLRRPRRRARDTSR